MVEIRVLDLQDGSGAQRVGFRKGGVGADAIWAAGGVYEGAWDGDFVEKPEYTMGAGLGEVIEG